MKKKFLEMLRKKEERKKTLGDKANAATTVEELRSINAELETLNDEIAELRSMVDDLPDDEDDPNDDPQQRGNQVPPGGDPQYRNQPMGATNILGTYGVGGGGQTQQQRSADKYDTPEYREAFMNYVTKGVKSDNLEFRADATTGTSDIGAVIPTTILNRIVEKLKDYGRIYARVTKTSMKGGVEIPLSNAKPKATWVAAGKVAEKQKKTTSGTIVFSYHKLQVRVAVEIVADTVAMPVFEQTVSDNIYEAMIVALEEGIVNGTGTGQPLGITKDPDIPSTQILEVTTDDIKKYNKWTEIFGKLPRSYRNGAVLILADSDWSKYIEGMVDANGQPVARVTYGIDGTVEERLLGKEAIPVEDLLPSIDDAAEGEVFAIVCKLSDYMLNSNMQLTFKRYFNDDTDEWISKSTLICDGKLADKNGVVLLKKKESTTV
ncbi:phage major capsid protein [Heyndrickxia oleronia]|uniref:phage major capsid protein n=1 Tax=Heyndrickxia oleronia TaxID=38875 RepID=UPI001C0EADF2|nr:phage major capsid protein [Heyndrickxia oleronia]MBU5214490.1 phage major capsid protein [Heyndrickxia oleronia]